jgi:leucyl/phenylalanyl-tRNA--protein transferase
MSDSPAPFVGLDMEPGADLVALGGALEPAIVLEAYRCGIFPWYDVGTPVLWWSPDPRCVLPLEGLHVPRRLARTMRSGRFAITYDRDFEAVMHACDENRTDGSWIHDDIVRCYGALHRMGHAHSVEVRQGGRLVGGLYGVAFAAGFAAESMFHRVPDASKIALVALVRHLRERGFRLLDVQFQTPHLAQFGCVVIPRAEYLARVRAALTVPARF